MTKAHRIIAIIAGLLSIIGGLSTYFGLPLPLLLLFNKHTVTRISTNPQFSIEAIKTSNNVTVNSSDKFSYRFATPLSIRGVTGLLDSETVWVVVADEVGRFYLQYPPVIIRSGNWVVTNIRPLEGIKRIVFVHVNAEGNQFFLRKVEHNEWGKFNTMPSGTTELAFVEFE